MYFTCCLGSFLCDCELKQLFLWNGSMTRAMTHGTQQTLHTSYRVTDVHLFQVEEDFLRHGFFFVEAGSVVQRQVGVMRINCIDCLDRTNVVQGVLGRKVCAPHRRSGGEDGTVAV